MTGVAVVKPDHLGDLVLASPAIRAIEGQFGGATLFISSAAYALARFLFPAAALRIADFPHLARRPVEQFEPWRLAAELDEFDLVLWLRDDPPIRAVAQLVRTDQDFAAGDPLVHESVSHKRMLARHLRNYSRSKLFGPAAIRWPTSIRSAGLCVSAGFPVNRWPNINWLRLALALAQRRIAVSLIGGPGEHDDLCFLSRCFESFSMPHRVIEGTADFAALLDEIDGLDVVIATDGGAAHLCSLAKPMLSIFGASPWRRYAPFGRENIVLTRNLACSPCVQFDMDVVNACMSRECVVALDPEFPAAIVSAPAGALPRWRNMIVAQGTSHMADK